MTFLPHHQEGSCLGSSTNLINTWECWLESPCPGNVWQALCTDSDSHSTEQDCCLVAKSHLTLCDPMDGSPPGSSVHGILQARILEWVVVPSSRGSSRPRGWTCISCLAGGFFTTEPLGSLEQGEQTNPGDGDVETWTLTRGAQLSALS